MKRGGKKSLPLAPVTIILNRPILFPRHVNGRRLGIRILGMMSCDGLPRSFSTSSAESSSPPEGTPDVTAWLFVSSNREASSNGFNDLVDVDFGLLGNDNGSSDDAPISSGVSEQGDGLVLRERGRRGPLCGNDENSCRRSAGLIVDRRFAGEPDSLVSLTSLVLFTFDASSDNDGSSSSALGLILSIWLTVSSRLCTPNIVLAVLSRDNEISSENDAAISITSLDCCCGGGSRARKKVVGPGG